MRLVCAFLVLPLSTSGFGIPKPWLNRVGESSRSPWSVSRLASSAVDQQQVAPAGATISENKSDEQERQTQKIRPLHQNWWPCISEPMLDAARPNAMEVLGTKLVIFQSSPGEWTCLEDRCSHRFAPLSEGRVVFQDDETKKSCLQCSYHGWEFNSDGRCQNIPQTDTTAAGPQANIRSFPIRVAVGMVWVYMDPETPALGDLLELPISPLLKRWHSAFGDGACYVRDLPYGFELLGENLMDLSHLPYAHHSFGNLNRDKGGPLPFRMLGASERSKDNPLIEAVLTDAKRYDPIFKGMPNVAENATLTVGFYEPSHIRYTRRTLPGQETHVELFLCPTRPGKSRILMYNAFEPFLIREEQQKEQPIDIKGWLSSPKSKIISLVTGPLFRPGQARNHVMSHGLFDADGIFLKMQGDRMQQADLTFRDYFTPAAADSLVNAFRRTLERSAERTQEEYGLDHMAETANPVQSPAYLDGIPRSVMLDRYTSHTEQCPVCRPVFEEMQRTQSRLQALQTALTGAAGASTAILLFAALDNLSVSTWLVAAATLVTSLGVVGVDKWRQGVEEEIKKFVFVDYVHADMD